jgi:hypothetical protein
MANEPLVDEAINENITEDGKQLSKEELAARRAEITKYYEEHIPSLKTQLEYEGLLRDIEKVRAERLQAQMFVQQTMTQQQAGQAGANSVPPSPGNVPPAKTNTSAAKPEAKRTLKKTAKANA